MRLVSWNVNGVRAATDKGLKDFVTKERPDVLCLQETKARGEQVSTIWLDELGYRHFWNAAKKPGYSGTAIWSLVEPKKVVSGMDLEEHDQEGRVLTATFEDFHLINVYTPNAQNALKRLEYRQEWDKAFLAYVKKKNRRKPVIFCGDLNVAHKEIDLTHPTRNRRNAGFTDEERAAIDQMIDSGFMDSFRQFDSSAEQYSWWTYRMNARERNVGWRLDYFFVDERFWPRVANAKIRQDIHGSDHCPVELHLQ